MDSEVVTEVPQNLQMLVRLIVRGFYSIEDVLIVDMLVRNLCMSEEDICELLKFDRKMLRQRMNTLKADKLLQTGSKTVTLEDGKTTREQYYFINYKSFVNVVKYKLDHVRKKLEMEDRDQSSRASFKCENCIRTYTDLEADQLLDLTTGEFLCVICRSEVVEDNSGMPRHDTRILLSRFNEQMEQLFTLLREVENIKLAAEFSEPKPQDFSSMKKGQDKLDKRGNGDQSDNGRMWSGEASKGQGFHVESSIDVNINTEAMSEQTVQAKEKPIWLTDASSFVTTNISGDAVTSEQEPVLKSDSHNVDKNQSTSDDVMSLLQQHERKRKNNYDSDSNESVEIEKTTRIQPVYNSFGTRLPSLGLGGDIEEITISDDEESHSEPMISVDGTKILISAVDSEVISKMTQDEKNQYITAYQEYYSAMDI